VVTGAALPPKLRDKFGLELTCPQQSRVYHLHASSQAELDEWARALQAAITALNRANELNAKLNAAKDKSGGGGVSATPTKPSQPSSSSAESKDSPASASRPAPLHVPSATAGSGGSGNSHAPLQLSVEAEFRASAGVPQRVSSWRAEVCLAGFGKIAEDEDDEYGAALLCFALLALPPLPCCDVLPPSLSAALSTCDWM
jgi:hypothetical protein